MSHVDPTGVDATEGKKPGFLSTRNGKLILGGVALLVLVIIGAVVAVTVLGLFGSGTPQPTGKVVVKGSTVATAAPVVVPVNPPEKPLSATFTFRDIFVVTIKPSVAASGVAGALPTVPADTLYLVSISSENGVSKATFVWNNASYTVGENEVVDSSPWKVLSIGSQSAVLLYGDDKVTLSVSQGITK